jgi:hypothetical protein
MIIYTRFEDLPVWQEAAQLYCSVLDLIEESNDEGDFFAICYLLFAILVPKVLQRWSI